MDIIFDSDRFREECNDSKRLVRRYGKNMANRLIRRLNDLRAAETLDVMRKLGGRCHELKGNRAGQLSLDVDRLYRLIFKPANDPVPRKPDGGLDWTRVTAVLIIGVEDTHG